MKKLLFVFLVMTISSSLVQAQSKPVDSTLKQYVGTYKFAEGSPVPDVVVSFDQGVLNMSSSAGTSELDKKGVDTFFIVTFEGTAVFKRDANKKIIGVTIDARGYLLEGTRSEPAAYLLRRKRY
jgi:hypothetical protein